MAQLRTGLAATTVPDDFADTLLSQASPLWLSSDTATLLAEDLALCYPPLNPSEVRAKAAAAEQGWRLTVVAHDRKGLLADTAEILAARNYSVRSASVATWEALELALHSITVSGPAPPDSELDTLGTALRAASHGRRPPPQFVATGRATVQRTGDVNGDPMISVVAPDQPGLLAAICRWFAEADASIAAAWVSGEDDVNDVFVVRGDVDVAALERRLSADDAADAPGEALVTQARRTGESVVRGIGEFLAGLRTRQ